MAENPHDLEKQIRGLGLTDLIASGEGSIVDKISQLKFDYNTGNSQALHAIEKTLKEYNKSLANIAGEGLVRTGLYKTDTLGAGFLPATITGFFNSATNERLFKFFTEDNNAMLYGFRKLNDGYTGYACRVRRMYDLAMVDVKFDANGIVSPSSEVDLVYTGFGTGLIAEEQTFSGFCHPSYLPKGMTDSEYSTTTIAKLYSQADGPDFTGEFELTRQEITYGSRDEGPTMASGENFDLDVNGGTESLYGDLLATDEYDGQSNAWKIFKGTGLPVGVGGRKIMFPMYGKDRQFRTFQVLYPINFTTTGTTGIISETGHRWVMRDSSVFVSQTQNWSEVVAYYNRSTVFSSYPAAFANQLITSDSTNRPYEYTSWTLRERNANNPVTFVYYVNKLNNQPIIATGATKMFYDEGTNRLGMKFNAEGNASVLHNASDFINLGSEASVGFVVRTDKTGENQTVFSQGEQENVAIEGPATAHDGAFLGYGLHFASSQYAWKGRFYNESSLMKTSQQSIDGVTPTVPNSGRDTNTHFIQMHVSTTAATVAEGKVGILEFDGLRTRGFTTGPDSSQAFLNDVTRIGARLDNGGTLTEGLDGTIYEMIFFRNDSQLDQDELNRYRPNVVDYHDITLQNE